MTQLNNLPVYPTPLIKNGETLSAWYFFWSGLWRGLPPEPEVSVTLTGSPFTYNPSRKGTVIVSGGTVTLIEFSRDGVTFYNAGVTAGMLPVNAADQLRITYVVAPTVTFVPT